jgi:hypothetical protein
MEAVFRPAAEPAEPAPAQFFARNGAGFAVLAVYLGYFAVHLVALAGRVADDDDFAGWLVAVGLLHLLFAQVSLRAAHMHAARKHGDDFWLRLLSAGHRPDSDALGAALALVDALYGLALAAAWARVASPDGDVDDALFWGLWALGVAACLLCFTKTCTRVGQSGTGAVGSMG